MKTLQIAKRTYRMNDKEAKDVLKMASENVPCGIYAVQKGDYIELKNLKLTKTQLKEQRRLYKEQGFKVYCNGL